MAITAEPEYLRPGARYGGKAGSSLFNDENLEILSHLLDDFIQIPGTQLRLGLDGLVGLIPVVGDAIGGILSMIIIVAAVARGVPRSIIMRMFINVGIEVGVGSIPVLGDLFDIGWRANRRNYKLLLKAIEQDQTLAR